MLFLTGCQQQAVWLKTLCAFMASLVCALLAIKTTTHDICHDSSGITDDLQPTSLYGWSDTLMGTLFTRVCS